MQIPWGRNFTVILFICIALLAVYAPVRQQKFINLDDPAYISRNPIIQAGITPQGILWAFNIRETPFYFQPLTYLSLMAEVEILGVNPGRHKSVNLLLHIINSIMLYLVLKGMTQTIWRSAGVAIFFALHPLCVDTVAYIAERKNLLGLFFMLLALYFWIFYTRQENNRAWFKVYLAYILGFCAKPLLVMLLPFLLVLLDYWPLGRFKTGLLLREKLPFFGLTLVALTLPFLSYNLSPEISSLDAAPLKQRVAEAFFYYGYFLRIMLWPFNFAMINTYASISIWLGSVLGIFLGGLTFGILKNTKFSFLKVGWLWTLGTLVPAVGLMRTSAMAVFTPFAYLPLIGLLIMLVWGTAAIISKFKYQAVAISFCLVILLSMLTRVRVEHWHNSVSIFQHGISINKNNWLAHRQLGVFWVEHNQIDTGLQHYSETLRINPAQALIRTKLSRAILLSVAWHKKKGDYETALQRYLYFLQYQPQYAGSIYYNMACLRSRQGRILPALALLSKAIKYGFADQKLFRTDPDLNLIRTSKGFKNLEAKLNAKINSSN